MMKRALISILLILITTPCLVSFQGQDFSARGKMQSLFIYNFASKYIEWPAGYKDGNFVIGVLGETTMLKELLSATNGKKAYNQNIEIKKFDSPADIGKCNMLFVPFDKTDALQDVMSRIKNGSTLVITEKEGVLKYGAIINFVNKEGKLKFETNKTEIEKREIRIAADLLKLSVTTI